MRVSDLMTQSLVTAAPDDLVDEGIVEMKMSQIRHLPIVDDRFRLVGIVSDRDLLLALGHSTDNNVYMKDIMTREVVTVAEDHWAADAARTLLRLKISALPVTGDEGQLIGMLTETDFLRLVEKTLRTDREEVETQISVEISTVPL